jgi:hypothetical protein
MIACHNFETFGVCKHGAQQGIGQCMARAMTHITTNDRRTRQCHIAKRVQHFVTHGLIRVA